MKQKIRYLRETFKRPRAIKLQLVTMTFVLTFLGLFGGIGRYGYLDDYSVLYSKQQNYLGLEHQWFAIGRPLAYLILKFLWFPVHNIDDLVYLHLLGATLAALFSTLVFTYFYQKTRNNFLTFTLSVSATLLSSGIIFISSWPENIFGIIALIFSTCAALFLDRPKSYKINVLAFLLCLLGFLTYQPSAIIFLLLPIIRHFIQTLEFIPKLSETKKVIWPKSFFQTITIFLISGVTALFFLKIGGIGFPKSARTTLIGPFLGKIKFIINQAIPTQFNFERAPFGKLPNLGFICIIGILFFIALISIKGKSLKYLGLVIMGAGCSLIPNFLTSENWASSRSLLEGQWFYASLSIISFFYFLKYIFIFSPKLINGFCLTLLVFSIFQSNQTLNRELRTPQLKELKAARLAISELNWRKTIYVKKSSWTDSIAPWVRADEFGIPSSCALWVPVPLTKLILQEQHGYGSYDVRLVETLPSNRANTLDFSKILLSLK